MLSWTVAKAGGPNQVYHAAVAERNKLYSFGGHCDGGTFNFRDQMNVHVFNTVSLCWKKLPPVTPVRGDGPLEVPSMRYGHTAVLIEDTVYIWGGKQYCNVLYAFDVDTLIWLKPRISGNVPEERMYHSACALEKVMFIHGGRTKLDRYTNDMYKLDTTTMVWTLINTIGTPPPGLHRQSSTIIGTRMFVFSWSIIRVFDTETNHWLKTTSSHYLPNRCNFSVFTYNGDLFRFGGYNNNQIFNDLWKFIPETPWTKVGRKGKYKFSPETSWKKVEPKGKGPCPIFGMCCCKVGDRIIIFGGNKGDYTHNDDLYILDLNPSLKMLCKLAVIQYGLDYSELPHDIMWELEAMTKKVSKNN